MPYNKPFIFPSQKAIRKVDHKNSLIEIHVRVGIRPSVTMYAIDHADDPVQICSVSGLVDNQMVTPEKTCLPCEVMRAVQDTEIELKRFVDQGAYNFDDLFDSLRNHGFEIVGTNK